MMTDNSQGYNYYDSQTNNDDANANCASGVGDTYAMTGEGYTAEAATDPNYETTEMTQQEYYNYPAAPASANKKGAATGDATEDLNYYDPNAYQSYYYQDDDGNYYYYADPQTEMLNETQDNAGVAPTPQNLVKSYEYEDWEPRSYNWFVNIVVDTFFTKAFRVYLTVLLYCAGVLIAVMGLNFTFQVMFRMFYPPDREKNLDLQALTYVAIFFYLSFVIATTLCVLLDMLKNLWWQQRDDKAFWGFSHRYFSKQKPPYMVYLVIFLVTVPMPLLWGIIDASVNHQSLLFFAQRYANVAVLAAAFLVVTCYGWFFWRALVYKRSAIAKAKDRDDYHLRERTYKKRPEKMTKRHWYHAQTILEEFGVDGKTLRYNCVVFTVGAIPIFALYAAQTLSTYTGSPSVVWGAVGSIAIMCIYLVAWMSLLRRKSQWSVYSAFFLDVVLAVIGAVGGGIGGKPVMVAIVLVLWVASQTMLTRKRRHSLTRKEACAVLKIPLNREMEKTKQKKRIDSYLFCCRDLVLDYLRCIDVKTYFGYRHPDVVAAERKYAIERAALRTDQKVLVIWWLIVMFAVAFVIALGNGARYRYPSTVAGSGSAAVAGSEPTSPMCQATYNSGGQAPLKMLDLAFLAALSYAYGDDGNTDFATWFSHVPLLERRYPVHLPPTDNRASDGITVRFSDYVDTSSDFHFITLNGNTRGLQIFRDVDEWGESIALQAGGAVSPLINIWPERYRYAFVQDGAFLKKWFPHSPALNELKAYIENLIESGLQDQILLVGDQFNGGYAKLLSHTYGLDFVAFNPPGVKYKIPFLPNGTQLSSVRGLFSYVDSLEDTANTIYMPCHETWSVNRCARLSTTISYLTEVCGDSYGRTYNYV